MYQYSEFDKAFLKERVAQYRDQVSRRLAGALTEEEFKLLRLMNGSYTLTCCAWPYPTARYRLPNCAGWQIFPSAGTKATATSPPGKTSSSIGRAWLIPLTFWRRWPSSICTLSRPVVILFATSPPIILPAPPWMRSPPVRRQWSTDHPEFQFLPRKFKIAISAGQQDRALIKAHDIGLRVVRGDSEPVFDIYVEGVWGRTPVVGTLVFERVSVAQLLPHLEAILTVYNLAGRRDNKYKARIKILLQSVGITEFKQSVAEILPRIIESFDQRLIGRLDRLRTDFATPSLPAQDIAPYWEAVNNRPEFKAWVAQNVTPHKQEGYASVTVSLKAHGQAPGDASATQMRALADLAEQVGFAELLRVSHEQNIVLPHVAQEDLMTVFDRLTQEGLATANIGLVSDLIACPGMDYCALATARSIPIGQQIARRYQHLEPELGPLKIKISGCINACGHHHVGDIGILGLDKAGVENYQITLGGRVGMDAALGDKMGPGFSESELLLALDRLFEAYLALRRSADETFSETVKRLGTSPFKSALYEVADAA